MGDFRPTLGARWFAFLWSRMDQGVDLGAADLKDQVLVDIPRTVVEVGAGRGANFHRYPAGTTPARCTTTRVG